MNKVKIFGAAAILSLMFATPVFAQAAIQEPGAFAFYYPNNDVLNGGRPTPAAGPPASHPVTITVDAAHPGPVIPSDFAGLSFERGPLLQPGNAGVSGDLFRTDNSTLVTLFRNMSMHSLRIGGGSGEQHTLGEIGEDIRRRLISLFLVGDDGRRPCFGWVDTLQTNPAWKDNILFNEYFHGDNGAGLGASHQTGRCRG